MILGKKPQGHPFFNVILSWVRQKSINLVFSFFASKALIDSALQGGTFRYHVVKIVLHQHPAHQGKDWFKDEQRTG